ncbi:MAG: M23 family metallopeptidase [Thermodesulfobacteria bacterium]|nr:M23 family metallopeptidase [Thermodesulfobacteriota bacterium]
MAILASGFVIMMLTVCWRQDIDEKVLVRQAQLPEGPASALFDFDETYFTEPFIFPKEVSENFPEPSSCSIYADSDVEGGGVIKIEGFLEKGESPDASLAKFNIEPKIRHQLLKSLSKAVNLRRCRQGERYVLSFSKDGKVVGLKWEKGPFEEYQVVLEENGKFKLSRAPVVIESRLVKVSGQFTSGLYDSFANYGLSSRMARMFGEIFSTKVDFNSDIRLGDSFSIIFNKYYKNGKYVGAGRILAAQYCSIGGSCYEAYYYQDKDGKKGAKREYGYFGPDGSSLSNSFLRTPLKVYRVTSRFTTRRFHPLLKVPRPHYGVDLAAPIGTPIMAVADGTVTFTGWQRGYGRIIVIKHKDDYKTYYGHLLRFAKGIRKGKRVHKKQIIGYVGRSGYATGPHLDYRVWHKGRFINPLKMRLPSIEKLTGARLKRFLKRYNEFHAILHDKNVVTGIISVKKETVNHKPNDLTG